MSAHLVHCDNAGLTLRLEPTQQQHNGNTIYALHVHSRGRDDHGFEVTYQSCAPLRVEVGTRYGEPSASMPLPTLLAAPAMIAAIEQAEANAITGEAPSGTVILRLEDWHALMGAASRASTRALTPAEAAP